MIRTKLSFLFFIISILCLVFIMPFFTKDMKKRPIYEKLGYVPTGRIMKIVTGEFRWFMGEYYTFKAITYYGDIKQKVLSGRDIKIEYYNLYKTIETAVILNPYHEDAYYFAQAIFIWDIGRIREVNALLKYVFRYRKWDFQIPFFLGFNHSYFLKQYKKAAEYYKKAAELSKNPFFASLSARYFYESGHTELGIMFLEYMLKNIRKKEIRQVCEKRLKALKAIYMIEKAIQKYKIKFGCLPSNIYDLVKMGILRKLPTDPYGGIFYIDNNGKVKTTSNLTEKRWKI